MEGEPPAPSLVFRSTHQGFHGSIKTSPQDFVVTEIDVRGQLVNSPSVPEEPVRVRDVLRDVPHKDTSRGTLLTEETPSADGAGDGEALSQECLDLSLILGSALIATLDRFASGVQASSETRNMEMSLGTFPDKHQRAIVHSAVRHTYPFLMTVTDHEEILVREDPDFRELSQLVSVEEAEDFFRFKDAKVPGSTFNFRPDDIKEHRTSVHHFVSRKFGKLVETKSFGTQGRTAITVRLRERGGHARKRTAAERDEQDVYTGERTGVRESRSRPSDWVCTEPHPVCLCFKALTCLSLSSIRFHSEERESRDVGGHQLHGSSARSSSLRFLLRWNQRQTSHNPSVYGRQEDFSRAVMNITLYSGHIRFSFIICFKKLSPV